MNITRCGKPCPLCRAPLLENVYQARSAQSDFPRPERVTGRRCRGCQATRPDQWTEVMRVLYADA
ncbi:hypothetical protein [Streptomyces antimycoticus]|uniref:hypothetical protein n=1 Tax=Streptomyces antimycoticus TaxID=68175 RepID=UPI000A35EC4F|nr:hypothetical protein [Streptomyces antimycoticus]